ncbi:hypothetical protein [Candidatus Clostridium radicumherbarum]|uniref:Uncharacterized protein n=1 Tax=Candidatus Clostridium radicumherbarum TaxID=3381662 RepID=A0ABW8TWM4_9CLOT
MKTFKLSFRTYKYVLIMFAGLALVSLLYSTIWSWLFVISSYIFGILVIIDSINTKIIVEEDRLIYKQSFRTRVIFWKDIKAVIFEKGMEDFQITVWLLTSEDMAVYRPLRTIGIRYLIKDYEILIRLIIERCKNNPNINIEKRVLELILPVN